MSSHFLSFGSWFEFTRVPVRVSVVRVEWIIGCGGSDCADGERRNVMTRKGNPYLWCVRRVYSWHWLGDPWMQTILTKGKYKSGMSYIILGVLQIP